MKLKGTGLEPVAGLVSKMVIEGRFEEIAKICMSREDERRLVLEGIGNVMADSNLLFFGPRSYLQRLWGVRVSWGYNQTHLELVEHVR